jgi:hypothetical protein
MLVEMHGTMPTVATPYHFPVLTLGILALVATAGSAIWANYFYGWSFPASVLGFGVPLLGVAYLVCLLFGKDWTPVSPAEQFEGQLWIAIAIIPFLFIRTFERYLLPLSIPLALLATYVLHGCEISRRRQLLSAVVLTAIPVLIVTALTVWLSTSSLTIILTALISVLLLTAFTLAWRRETIATTVSLITATAVVLAYIYPQLGVNRLPEVVLADFRDGSGAHYASPYPGTLSMALGRSVPIIERENRNALQSHALVNGRLILRRDDLATLRQSALALDIDVTIEKRFSMWYSRGSFLSLSKPGMSGEERWRAIVARQVSSLQPEFVTARVSMRTAQ